MPNNLKNIVKRSSNPVALKIKLSSCVKVVLPPLKVGDRLNPMDEWKIFQTQTFIKPVFRKNIINIYLNSLIAAIAQQL